jgi:hypothetical protein
LFIVVLLSVIGRDFYKDLGPFGNDYGIQFRDCRIEINIKEMQASFIIYRRAFNLPGVVDATNIGQTNLSNFIITHGNFAHIQRLAAGAVKNRDELLFAAGKNALLSGLSIIESLKPPMR